jgi:hypothetical protein
MNFGIFNGFLSAGPRSLSVEAMLLLAILEELRTQRRLLERLAEPKPL